MTESRKIWIFDDSSTSISSAFQRTRDPGMSLTEVLSSEVNVAFWLVCNGMESCELERGFGVREARGVNTLEKVMKDFCSLT